MVNEHRDNELIIFGIPIFKPEDPVSTVLRVATSLDVPLTSSEVISALFRIGRRIFSSGPVVAKLITIARRNELLAKFRRRSGSGFAASNVDCSLPSTRVYLYERSTASERRLFAEARQLAKRHNIKHVWMRRGVTYFRVSDGSPLRRYLSQDSMLAEINTIVNPIQLPHASSQAGPSVCSEPV
ncbi:hypothetical protein DBV15_12420 [Temnothorax longispinosus]|uniref:FP protein C-terminal domain-containing protein n=1 Tax=Temnothorax longispinosus TaxID=300112 RepID=A0A4S2L1I7_9HYME|nr:hypothetical protein DBV15_12420 [Temnothorax longispinosus]